MSPILGIWASQITGRLWEPAGAYDALASVTVGSGGSSSIVFAGIPTGYKHIQIRAISFGSSGQIALTMNGDSGSNYAFHQVSGNGSSALATAGTSQSRILNNFNTATSTTYPVAMVIDILDYSNTNKNKTIRNLSGIDTNGGGSVQLVSGLWMSTNAVSTLTFTDTGGNIAQYSQFALYGIK